MTANPQTPPSITLIPASESDIDRLVALKIAVQGEHLRRLGRFTPERARRRFLEGFGVDVTRLIHVDGDFAGCVTVHRHDGYRELEHLYIAHDFQGRGIGAEIVRGLLAECAEHTEAMRTTVLNQSPANAFYLRLGFREVARDEIDVHYVWEG